MLQHSSVLKEEFERYFLKFKWDKLDLVKNRLAWHLKKFQINIRMNLKLRRIQVQKFLWLKKSLKDIWFLMVIPYTNVVDKVVHVLILFVSK